MTANPIRHSVTANARFGTAYHMPSQIKLLSKSPPRSPPPPPHPILSDVPAIEAALGTLFRLCKHEAIKRGLMPELDLAAQQFRAEHGRIAALIADPVTQALCDAASVLTHHLRSLVSEEEQVACVARLRDLAGPEGLYNADKRLRH